MTIADGEFIILVGPSGCGKSTTLNMIAGLEDITSGELRIGGERVNEKAPKDRDIAMVFQSYALYPHMTVRQNIAFPLTLAKMKKAEIARKVDETAKILDLTELLDRKPGPAVGRSAPAGRDGPGDRARPQGVPDGRAAVEPRRQAARADALGDRAAAEPAGHHHRLRHARPDRGDDARRPRRGAARRGGAADRHARGALQPPRQPVRRRLHRIAGDELLPGDDDRRRCATAVRRGHAHPGGPRPAGAAPTLRPT